MSSAVTSNLPDYGILGESAILYQRVFELCVGERFLDAACNGGFFPLLLAERIPFVSEVVGVDIDAGVFKVAQELAMNLLKVTVHRLIFAVPYETSEPEVAYGHLQLFSRAKLEAVGAWCIEQLRGAARMWYEDLPRSAGLLLIEKLP